MKRQILIEMDIERVGGPADVAMCVLEDEKLKTQWTPAQAVTVARVFSDFATHLLDMALEKVMDVENFADEDGKLTFVIPTKTK